MDTNKIIYTIGHSNRSFEEFLAMLQSFNINLVADVRSLPGSRKYPHFDKEKLETELPANKLRYLHMPALGGRRSPAKDSKNTLWQHKAFRGYADYMDTGAFEVAMNDLEMEGLNAPVAYMCSEAVWWRCHRAMISDYLKARGWQVMHIMSVGKAKEHPYTSVAKILNGEINYEDGD